MGLHGRLIRQTLNLYFTLRFGPANPERAQYGTGGGDVKLMASLGVWLGPYLIMRTFFYSAIAGGLIALVIATRRRRIATTLRGAARLVATPMNAKREIETVGPANRFPYAPAIAAGVVMAMLGL